MDKKHQQDIAMLLMAAFPVLAASRLIPSNGSVLMDYVQGFLAGIGIVLMIIVICVFSKHYKRVQR